MSEQQILAAELHKPKRVRFLSRRVVVKDIDDLWQADLVEMGALAKWNRDTRYLLTVIDVGSRYAFARPVRRKTAEAVTAAFRDVLEKSGRSPGLLQTDQGKEFFNRQFSSLCKTYRIHHYHTYSDKKASICERFNRTLKTKMWKKFTELNTQAWLGLLPQLIDQYNHTKHRSIQMAPADVTAENIKKVGSRPPSRKKPPPFKLNDLVRIARFKNTFAKGYTTNFTEELFKIIAIKQGRPYTYTLADLHGEAVQGTFYPQELQKTSIPSYARIEKVLARKRVGGKPYIRVKWSGYASSFNQWIPLDRSVKL